MEVKSFHQYLFYSDGTIYNTLTRRFINKCNHKNKYYNIKLKIDNKYKTIMLHRILYYVFIEEFDLGDRNVCIVAKDGDFLNTDLSNLELKHRKDIVQGENTSLAKLSNKDVSLMKEMYKNKNSQKSYRDIGKLFGVSKTSVVKIINGNMRNSENYKLQ